MSNNSSENIVPMQQDQLPDQQPFPVTMMETVAGSARVPNHSYDVQGQSASSEKDLPIDVNAMQGANVTSESLQAPSTGTTLQNE
jgi:hypothetical protein